ncbi:beta-N-acetylhexosaminidase (EC:3.2.1.52) [Streptoalloteichus tenebrarius]|uniref:beta-N-acetylhexosaminidase n=2 Tax=Actinomycetes TaxID=1760 RepID=A0ABT1HR33_STRSD|nr:glycoside hydrolase family 3 protein [Streptoalloteichus tenebrarius]MCP2257984.1 beta-N-acetylhexosaminidase (EC:3.2.1.52) [Streptoalloteichus tenebrarius]BFF01651.1 glycoside hydrolase family 3 protein [Streptoalloteichus tenebrarius]
MAKARTTSRRVLTTLAAVTLAGSLALPSDADPSSRAAAGAHGASAWANATLRRMSLEEKVGQLFVTYAYGSGADSRHPKNQEEFGVDTPAEVVRRYHLGGVIYFSWTESFVDPKQVAGLSNGLQRAALTSGAGVPLLVSTDQEHGVVTRFGAPATQFPGSMALGASRSVDDARGAARIAGAELRAVGINQNYAPVADVNTNPANPVIGVRSFSSDPGLAAEMVAAQVRGYEGEGSPRRGVSATIKHFPGHGDTNVDSHSGLPVIHHDREQWRRLDAPPFRAAIAQGVDMIMSGHLVVPGLDDSQEPATVSPKVLTGILREELGFRGVVITDSLQMDAVRARYPDAELAVRALLAGADQLLMPQNLRAAYDGVLAAVRSGRLSERRIDDSVRRVLTVKFNRGIPHQPFVDETAVDRVVGTREHLAAAQEITDRTLTALRNDDGLLPLRTKPGRVLVTGWGESATKVLTERISARGVATTRKTTGPKPSPTAIGDAVAAARDHDLTVVLTHQAWDDSQQQDLVRELAHSGKPVITVAVRDPYDAAYVDQARTWLVTYSYGSPAMESLAKVLFGESSPRGKLPVTVPEPGRPDTPRFPFGHGLSW